MPLSAIRFHQAFERFQAIEQAQSGHRLTSFGDDDKSSGIYRDEEYKVRVALEATDRLERDDWDSGLIGTGRILERVISAIEIKEPKNNLVEWEGKYGPGTAIHEKLRTAQGDSIQALETVFYEMYHERRRGESQFTRLMEHCGRRYPLLAYLFFIAKRDEFLPLAPRYFDKALEELGSPLRLEGNCSWDNYQLFLAAMQEVRKQLRGKGITGNLTLLDAHSFCWVLGRNQDEDQIPEPTLPSITRRKFKGTLAQPRVGTKFTPNDGAGEVDRETVEARKKASGQLAEELVCLAERERLTQEGKPDLAERVEQVSKREGLGYDIKSFDCDGTDRFIEVKNVSQGNRFYLTENEWQNSRARLNYWFCLVSQADTTGPVVDYLSAEEVQEHHLRPVQYLVTFER